jgi:threonine/homoserine/homoserine lactone efflux protein
VADLLAVTLTWWIVSLSGVLAPGPISAMAITEGARRGAMAGALVTAGHAIAELGVVVALAFGLDHTLKQPRVLGLIGACGGVVLFWMGLGIVRAAGAGRLDPYPSDSHGAAAPTATVGGAGLVRAGLLVSLGNPYWLLWWATVGATYFVVFSRFGVAAVLVAFLLGHLALDLGWMSFLAFAVGAGRGRVPLGVYRGAMRFCGVFIIVMSAYFFYAGLRYLFAV